MRTAQQQQKHFLPTFGLLLLADFMATLVSKGHLTELQGFVSLWFGPLDDIFYGIVGVQALYYLIDPLGETRDESKVSTTTGTVKKVASLLSQPEQRKAFLPRMFFSGSLRSVGMLAGALLLTVAVGAAASSLAIDSLLLVLQRHLSYLLPLALAGAAALLWGTGAPGSQAWRRSMLIGSTALLVSMAVDGRWAHHVHHLLASLSNPQAWGAAACWIGAGAAAPLASKSAELEIPAS